MKTEQTPRLYSSAKDLMERTEKELSKGESARTPGPWQADKWATGWTVSAPDSHYSVCHLEDCNNAEANARLIAAAPELLAACKELMEHADWSGCPPGYSPEDFKPMFDRADSAIMSAEGRSNE